MSIQDITFPDYGFSLTPEQTAKGLAWLMNEWKTPTGKERVNNPFGYRETAILEDFKEFKLIGFYDCSRYGAIFVPILYSSKCYTPLYRVIAKEGNSFEYYYNFEGLSIVG
jgi:hypothetical protein